METPPRARSAAVLSVKSASGSRGAAPRDPEWFREDFLALLELLRADKIHPVIAERCRSPGRAERTNYWIARRRTEPPGRAIGGEDAAIA